MHRDKCKLPTTVCLNLNTLISPLRSIRLSLIWISFVPGELSTLHFSSNSKQYIQAPTPTSNIHQDEVHNHRRLDCSHHLSTCLSWCFCIMPLRYQWNHEHSLHTNCLRCIPQRPGHWSRPKDPYWEPISSFYSHFEHNIVLYILWQIFQCWSALPGWWWIQFIVLGGSPCNFRNSITVRPVRRGPNGTEWLEIWGESSATEICSAKQTLRGISLESGEHRFQWIVSRP